MAKLTKEGIRDKKQWEQIGIKLPNFDFDALCEQTKEHPRWAHVGPGNIFRGFVAALAQKLLDEGKMKSGITAVSTFDHQILDMIYNPYDNLALQVLMHADGQLDKTVIASIGDSLRADAAAPEEWDRLKKIFANPELQMVSFTITEKGYHIKGMNGEFYPAVLDDFKNGALGGVPNNGMSIIAALLLERFRTGAHPIAMVSMDNFSHNGDKLFDSVRTVSEKWVENGTAPQAFLDYIKDPSRVSFPWSMIDKITPRPDATVSKELEKAGFESTKLVVTDKNTYIAPFVNAEAPQYLVIEDNFPNGRPPLDQLKEAGVYLVDRKTVDLVERMKVCTCLNPLHTAMCIFGCLLGYTSIAAETKDPAIAELIRKIGYVEGMPVVADPGILNPADFLKEVIEDRLPNPFIPDTPQRIATDTSQKMPIRFGETIRLYGERADLDVQSLHCIPLAIAAWCRYLMGLDDNGETMQLSPDPLMDQLQSYLKDVQFGKPETTGDALHPILSNTRIFGLDLYKAGLGTRIETYFKKMIAGKGAVRKTIDEEVLD